MKVGDLVILNPKASKNRAFADLYAMTRYGFISKNYEDERHTYWVTWFKKDGSYLLKTIMSKNDLSVLKKL